MASTVIEAQATRRVFFRPLGRPIRGTVDFTKPRRAAEFKLAEKWPEPVPGLILGVDLAGGSKYVRDPLYDSQHTAVRRRIEKEFRLGPQREEFTGESLATWLYWIGHAVGANKMRLIAGEIPTPIDPSFGDIRKHFIRNVVPSDRELLTDVLTRLGTAIETNTRLISTLIAKQSK